MSDKLWGDAEQVDYRWDEGDVLVIEHREHGIHSSSEDWRMTVDFASRLSELLNLILDGEA